MTGVMLGDMHLARGIFVRAAELSHKAGNISEELLSRISVMGHTLNLGEFAAAEAQLAEMKALQAALPDPEAASLEIQSTGAALLTMKGQWSEGLQLLRKLLPEARERGNLQMVSNTCDHLAGIQIELVRLGIVEGEARDAALAEAEAVLDRVDRGRRAGWNGQGGLALPVEHGACPEGPVRRGPPPGSRGARDSRRTHHSLDRLFPADRGKGSGRGRGALGRCPGCHRGDRRIPGQTGQAMALGPRVDGLG